MKHVALDMKPDNKIVQGLWIGPELSVMEQLSINSFLKNGHEYHLYVYEEVKNIPANTMVRDANEILPSSRIFQYKQRPSYAGFSNFFRYKLLVERGGWWADTDVVCIKQFDFADEHVFATEFFKDGVVATSSVIKAPSGSRAMAYAWKVCQTKDPESLVWGETGPKLIGQTVTDCSLEKSVVPPHVFCPLPHHEWHRVLEPAGVALDEGSYAVHLWNEKWRAAGQDKDGRYHVNSFYEQIKRRYLTDRRLPATHPTSQALTQSKSA